MAEVLSKAYDPKAVEKPLYRAWEKSGFFAPDTLPGKKRRKPFVIAMPPPNVTGELHIGHATGLTIEDILIRYKRLAGFAALWVPGTDHAGIATQVMVERLLQEAGLDRRAVGRETFLKHVWQWKEKYGDRITAQIRSLGSSCDWTREHFTMDPQLTTAVQTAFIRLFREGRIYRGERIISWCPRDRTALSDLEVKYVEQQDKLFVVRYPLMGSTRYVSVATTRPETMLGDAAIAVHPKDRRYAGLVGKTVTVPIVEREIPIIADPKVDPDFGTGAVKVTPGHDKLDHNIGRRHRLPTYTVIDEDGKMTKDTGEYSGMSIQATRTAIVKTLEENGQLESVAPYVHSVGTCDRCGHPIEPRISLQWFVSMKPFAQAAIRAVQRGQIRIIPKRYEKVYFHWLRHLEDWCISRQLWWGHRIPIWYCANERERGCPPIASADRPKRCPHCRGKSLMPEGDTLDTWFSSSLWTFSTLGWPKATSDLRRFHPTDVMETGWDILFFWVTRMAMMSLKLLKQVPFRTIYLHGLVLDRDGKKMSKSKGTGIDPIPMTEKYGTDAIRLSLVIGTTAGQDFRLSEEKISHERNFINKLWNVGRFILQQPASRKPAALTGKSLADRWILSRLQGLIRATTEDLEAFRFAEAGQRLEEFVWHELADWYLEAGKIEPNPGVLRHVFEQTLMLLHPFIPYVTESLWQAAGARGKRQFLMVEAWPKPTARFANRKAEADFNGLQRLITAIRNVRINQRVSSTERVVALIAGQKTKLVEENAELVKAFCRLREIGVVRKLSRTNGAAPGIHFHLAVPDRSGDAGEKTRKKLEAYVASLDAKLRNEQFVARAPKAVVAEVQRKRDEAVAQLERLRE